MEYAWWATMRTVDRLGSAIILLASCPAEILNIKFLISLDVREILQKSDK